jgi:hypothetical protein
MGNPVEGRIQIYLIKATELVQFVLVTRFIAVYGIAPICGTRELVVGAYCRDSDSSEPNKKVS